MHDLTNHDPAPGELNPLCCKYKPSEMVIYQKFKIRFFAVALLVPILVQGCVTQSVEPSQISEQDTSAPRPTSTKSATSTVHSVEFDYSDLPPLDSLIVSKELISESTSLTPSLLFNPNLAVKSADISLVEDCGVDCINLAHILHDQSLIISLVRYQNEDEARNQIGHLWNEITPDIPSIFIKDEYEGHDDKVWAAQDHTTLYNVRREGPVVIYMSHFFELPEDAVDFDGNHYLGELSCLGTIQAQVIQISSTGSIPYIDQEPESCWEWLW